jgi:hypothetical protein
MEEGMGNLNTTELMFCLPNIYALLKKLGKIGKEAFFDLPSLILKEPKPLQLKT